VCPSDNSRKRSQLLNAILALPPAWLALTGVLLGWLLKLQSDVFAWWINDRRQYRKATFYLLRAYKAILDYDRATTHFRNARPEVDVYHKQREHAVTLVLNALDYGDDTFKEAIDLLSQISPALAMNAHESLMRVTQVMQFDAAPVLERSAHAYVELMRAEDYVLGLAQTNLRKALFRSARKSFSVISTWRWLRVRESAKGRAEYSQGLEQHKPLRDLVDEIVAAATKDM